MEATNPDLYTTWKAEKTGGQVTFQDTVSQCDFKAKAEDAHLQRNAEWFFASTAADNEMRDTLRAQQKDTEGANKVH